MDKDQDEVFQIKARRCRRCGGILTSRSGLRDGYGPCCLRKMQIEEADRRMMKDQVSLFQERSEDEGEDRNEADDHRAV